MDKESKKGQEIMDENFKVSWRSIVFGIIGGIIGAICGLIFFVFLCLSVSLRIADGGIFAFTTGIAFFYTTGVISGGLTGAVLGFLCGSCKHLKILRIPLLYIGGILTGDILTIINVYLLSALSDTEIFFILLTLIDIVGTMVGLFGIMSLLKLYIRWKNLPFLFLYYLTIAIIGFSISPPLSAIGTPILIIAVAIISLLFTIPTEYSILAKEYNLPDILTGKRVRRSLAILGIISVISIGIRCWLNASNEIVLSNIPSKVRHQMVRLLSWNPKARADAAFQLGMMGRQAAPAVPSLIKMINDRSPIKLEIGGPEIYPATEAIEALGRINDPRAIAPLLAAMKHQDWNISIKSKLALKKINDPGAIKPLISALKDKDVNIRMVAVETLAEIKDSAVVEPLITALKDKDMAIRKAAVEALIKITKKNFGDNPEEWQRWWYKNKKSTAYSKNGEKKKDIGPHRKKSNYIT